ncbi:MAG TPA: hypothetical protein VMF91_09820 [Bryobacteraceae bacterium]|nr:hypothetical protein [Bryobacteraceae bacterium]
MDEKVARSLLESLLSRLKADARREAPQYEGVVSGLERGALAAVLAALDGKQSGEAAEASPVDHSVAETEPTGTDAVPLQPLPPAALMGPRGQRFKLDDSVLSGPPANGSVLCIDFGTAKSKAFAATLAGGDDEPDLHEIGLGRKDNDIDGSGYTVASSVWISDEGLIFAGSEALRRSMDSFHADGKRKRLDSLKQHFSHTGTEQKLGLRKLDANANPTGVDLTYEDVITFYLAYLTDLASPDISIPWSRNVKRRFTIPAWSHSQRAWAGPALGRYVARAQMLADTFRGQWKQGIPADELKRISVEATKHDDALKFLLDGSEQEAPYPPGLLEPLAAGSGRVWTDRAARNLVFVVDVGAGTTDYSLFWVTQDARIERRTAFPILPGGEAIRMAGDNLDEILLHELLSKVHGGLTSSMRGNIEVDLRLRGLRRLKEQMFINGRLELTLVNDQSVSIEAAEFLQLEQVKGLGAQIEKAITRFFSSVNPTWQAATERPLIVLTGGGANLPMIKDLQKKPWEIGGGKLVFKPAREIPEFVAETFDADFQREYPQLAVAIGGALPIISEKDMLNEWQGGAPAPGGLERFRTKGI